VEGSEHSEMQYHLAKLGKALGYKVWIAQNDHKREWNNVKLGEFSIQELAIGNIANSVRDTVSLIDVIWLDRNENITAAFEVEKSTSIYSGILRLYDLSIAIGNCNLYLIAPDKREREIKAQLLRPSLTGNSNPIAYILFSDLRCDCEAMCKFGSTIAVLDKISKVV